MIVFNWTRRESTSCFSLALVYSVETYCSVCLERFPLPLGAWDGQRYFIVALPEPSI